MNPQQGAYAQYGQQPNVNYPYPPAPFAHQQTPYHNPPIYQVPAGQQQSHPPFYPPPPQTTTPQHQQSHHAPPSSATRQRQHQSQQLQPDATRQHALPSAPSSPENGPGAPPPDPQSPSQYDEDLVNALHRDDNSDGVQQDDAGEPVFHLPPPPETTYPNEQALEESIHAWSLEHGYELVRRASKKNAKGVLYKRYYHCSKHGKAANTGRLTEETRVRVNRKSQRMNCPMSLAIVAIDPANPQGEWQVRHRKTHHNHGPLDALALAGHRRRARAGGIEQAVDGLFAIGTPTAQVLQFLQRTNPNGLFTRTDVANMKLKYKKFGTCLERRDTAVPHGGACKYCRSKKTKCDGVRPVCGNCAPLGIACEYTQEPEEPPQQQDGDADMESVQVDDETQQHDPSLVTPQQGRGSKNSFHQNAQRAEEILANLQAFQTQHITPTRLEITSSAVEILAASSCGSGESYRLVPILQSAHDWQNYRNAMTEACMKENTFEVLVAAKTEPVAPPSDCKVEDWNEYVKQLAIFNRRNTALTGALWGTLNPAFRNRVQHLRMAAEIWAVLEEACLPRGSDQGFRLYNELHNVTHANSADLKDYIIRLETAFIAFNRLSHHWRTQENHPPLRGNTTSSNASNPFTLLGSAHPSSRLSPVQPLFSEEMLCFLFLRNLNPEFHRWAEGLCATNNVGGFGTGPKLGFVDLTKRAAEFEITQRRSGPNGM